MIEKRIEDIEEQLEAISSVLEKMYERFLLLEKHVEAIQKSTQPQSVQSDEIIDNVIALPTK